VLLRGDERPGEREAETRADTLIGCSSEEVLFGAEVVELCCTDCVEDAEEFEEAVGGDVDAVVEMEEAVEVEEEEEVPFCLGADLEWFLGRVEDLVRGLEVPQEECVRVGSVVEEEECAGFAEVVEDVSVCPRTGTDREEVEDVLEEARLRLGGSPPFSRRC
jgi:hypothetical protein